MTHDVSPILDRHTQESLGRMLREQLDDACRADTSKELDVLLASLRNSEDHRDEPRSRRN